MMRFKHAIFVLVAATASVDAQTTEYCGSCGCFGAVEYSSLLAAGPTVTALAAFEAVVADNIVITVGSGQAIVGGTTYTIGPGASPVTAEIDGELFSFGSAGVGLPTTTVAPYVPTATSSTIANVVANGSVTLLVANPATASGSDAMLGHTLPTLSSSGPSSPSLVTSSGSVTPPLYSITINGAPVPSLVLPTTNSLSPIAPPPLTTSTTTTTTNSLSPLPLPPPTISISTTTNSLSPIPLSPLTTSPSTSTNPNPTPTLTLSTPGSANAAPTPTVSVEATNLDPTFINSVLQYTNYYRSINQAGTVSWDPIKAQYAQTYANKCLFQHSGGPYGENLAIGGYSNPAFYIWYWYDEIRLYSSYSAPNLSQFEEWGHFTQLVWQATSSIGCGYATACDTAYGQYYLVCEYDTGNVVPSSNFVTNVLTPTAAEPAAPTGFVAGY